MLRCGCAFVGVDGRALLGAVNGRYPPRIPFPAGEFMLRCGCAFVGVDGRALLGGVKGRYPPPFCAVVVWLPVILAPELLIPRPAGVPAFGFCIVPVVIVPRAPAASRP